MALSAEEVALLDKLEKQLGETRSKDKLNLSYYQGRQRVEQLGMAIPPAMRRFLVVVNWCRVVVDTIVDRQQVRSLVLPGEETADPQLRSIWDASNLSAHLKMFNRDRAIFGRAYMSVGSNETNPQFPLVRVESPLEMSAIVNVRQERIEAAARIYGDDGQGNPTDATLLLPESTVWVKREGSRWAEVDRDNHALGVVPVVMHLNRRMSGAWSGESQMSDVIPLVDAAARSLTNMQFAQESHGIPRMVLAGVDKADFADGDGNLIPKWQAYFNVFNTLTNAQAKAIQITPADLKNFETAVRLYGTQAATVTGFPARYFGITSVNPPTEGSIRADEATLIRSVETQNDEVGMTLGWVAALALRFATGQWVEGNRVRVDWFDPATPTIAQRMDAVVKAKQVDILSREGAWDELGWSEARKAKERSYFAEQAQSDPAAAAAIAVMNGTAGAAN